MMRRPRAPGERGVVKPDEAWMRPAAGIALAGRLLALPPVSGWIRPAVLKLAEAF